MGSFKSAEQSLAPKQPSVALGGVAKPFASDGSWPHGALLLAPHRPCPKGAARRCRTVRRWQASCSCSRPGCRGSACRKEVRVRHDLLAPPARAAAGRRVGRAAPGVAGAPGGCGATGLEPGCAGQPICSGEKAGLATGRGQQPTPGQAPLGSGTHARLDGPAAPPGRALRTAPRHTTWLCYAQLRPCVPEPDQAALFGALSPYNTLAYQTITASLRDRSFSPWVERMRPALGGSGCR